MESQPRRRAAYASNPALSVSASDDSEDVLLHHGKHHHHRDDDDDGDRGGCTCHRIGLAVLGILFLIAVAAAIYYRVQVKDFLIFPPTKSPSNPAESLFKDVTSAIGGAASTAASAVQGAAETAKEKVEEGAGKVTEGAGKVTEGVGKIFGGLKARDGKPKPTSGW